MRENQQVQPMISDDFQRVEFMIADGAEPLVLHMDRLHPDIIRRAAAVGMAQVRIVDAAAVSRANDDGELKTKEEILAEKRSKMADLIAHYETGTEEWSRVRTGGGGGKSLTVEAIARVKGVTYETALEWVDKHAEKTGIDRKKALAKLREARAVADAMRQIRDERAPKPKADSNALLEELGQ